MNGRNAARKLKYLALGGLLLFAGQAKADLYAVSGAGDIPSVLYRLDPTTGAVLQTIGAVGFDHVTALSFNPITGVLYGHVSDAFGSGETSLITIDVTTGAGTLVGDTNLQVPDFSFRADGTLYAWAEYSIETDDNDQLFTIDLGTGASTLFPLSGTGTSNTGLAFAPSGTLYLKPGTNLFTLDPVTGEETFVTALSSNLQNALTFDAAGNGFSIDRNGGTSILNAVDVVTGQVTVIGDTGVAGISALAFSPSAVSGAPEPATVGLFGVGIGILGLAARRRR